MHEKLSKDNHSLKMAAPRTSAALASFPSATSAVSSRLRFSTKDDIALLREAKRTPQTFWNIQQGGQRLSLARDAQMLSPRRRKWTQPVAELSYTTIILVQLQRC